jgi:uncharacterized membrane protein YeaQ/YmgE (transglycosylase-associated protein family)
MLMSVICWGVVGLAAGFVASKLMNGRGVGMAMDLVLGLIGAVIGGWIFRSVGIYDATGFNIWSLLVAVSGASVLLMFWHAMSGWNVNAIDMDQLS